MHDENAAHVTVYDSKTSTRTALESACVHVMILAKTTVEAPKKLLSAAVP
jgi:hypothetical protein